MNILFIFFFLLQCTGNASLVEVNINRCSVSVNELRGLEALYNSTNGANWRWRWRNTTRPTGTGVSVPPVGNKWTFPAATADPCSDHWQGIFCVNLNSTFCKIDKLILTFFNLRGSIPSDMKLLSSLSVLYLASNHLSNTIPPELFSITSLNQLYLNENRLTGVISIQISNLVRLTGLFLYTNELSGSLPSQLGNLLQLQILIHLRF